MQLNKEFEDLKAQLKSATPSQKKDIVAKLNHLIGAIDKEIEIRSLEDLISITQIVELQDRSKQIAKMENQEVITNELLINKEIAKLLPSLYQAEYENNSLEKANFFAKVFILLSKNGYKFDDMCIEGLGDCIEAYNQNFFNKRKDTELAVSFLNTNKDYSKAQALYLSLMMIFLNGFMPYGVISKILAEDEKVLNLSLNEIINEFKGE